VRLDPIHPELAYFAHALDKLKRRQTHMRSGEVEQVLAMALDPSAAQPASTAHQQRRPRLQAATASDGRSLEVGQASLSGCSATPPRRAPSGGKTTPMATRDEERPRATFTTQVKQDVFNMRAALRVLPPCIAGPITYL